MNNKDIKLRKVREIREGYGITGISLELSLEHIDFLCEVRDKIKANQKYRTEHFDITSNAGDILDTLLPALEMMCGNMQSINSPELWKIEE